MKITVDHARCNGHGVCLLRAPRVYELDDEGYNRMAPFEVPVGLEAEARLGAINCPEVAISIEE
jgi:ferredoxin